MTHSQTVLIIGSGGREHALAWKIAQSPHVGKVYVAPGNGGTTQVAENVPISFTDVPALLTFAKDHHVDLTVVGQEAASEAGAVDAFRAAGLAIFGPTQAAARIETSKAFSKDLMAAAHIPTAAYRNFNNAAEARAYIQDKPFPYVIKADGLATGKGVIICQTHEQAEAAIEGIMVKKIFGDSGSRIVIEDFLAGEEVSIHALSDGHAAVMFPSSQDHKQVNDHDQGPNTGGMGVIAPVPWVTPAHMRTAQLQIVEPALAELHARGADFTGCLYPGLMIDGDQVKTLEYNSRFGDPEAQAYLRLFQGDLFEVLRACSAGGLNPAAVTWQPGYVACICLASGGYPGDYLKGLPITGLEAAAARPDVVVFHAGTTSENGIIKTAGGRVLNVSATAPTLEEALDKAYAAIKLIHFDHMHYRTDIGRRPQSQ